MLCQSQERWKAACKLCKNTTGKKNRYRTHSEYTPSTTNALYSKIKRKGIDERRKQRQNNTIRKKNRVEATGFTN